MKVCLDTNVFIAIKNKEEDFGFCTKILDAIEEKHIDAMITASSINSNSDYFITFNETMLKKLEIQVLSPIEFVKNHL